MAEQLDRGKISATAIGSGNIKISEFLRKQARSRIVTCRMILRCLCVFFSTLVFHAHAQRGPIVDRHGVELTQTRDQAREYPFGALAAHVLGYACLEDGTWAGKSGVEKDFDEQLAELGEVQLTIDAGIQWIAEDAMRSVGRGAAVVLDPNTGEILASVSVPSFDPNLFSPTIALEDWNRYVKDKATPLFDRVQKASSPGSTFLIPVALAGLRTNSHKRPFFCSGGVQYGNKFMKCWIAGKGGQHGSQQLSQAFKRSCNCYFYQYANDTGIENIYETADLLGFGVPGMNERPGMVPTPDWLRAQSMDWSDAFTAMTAIGQGHVQATPLQMASVAGTVASGGKVYEPRLVKSVVDAREKVLVRDVPSLLTDLTEVGYAEDDIKLIAEGMWKVVHEEGGTAKRARSEEIEIAGRTGTAQTGTPNEPTNAWFVAFAPYENPKFAICIFVQNADSGGRVAAPIARRILERAWMLRQKPGFEPDRLEEAKGHFGRIESIEFED